MEATENLEGRFEVLNQDGLRLKDIKATLSQLYYLGWSQSKAL